MPESMEDEIIAACELTTAPILFRVLRSFEARAYCTGDVSRPSGLDDSPIDKISPRNCDDVEGVENQGQSGF